MDDIFGIVWPLVISVVRIYPHEIILYLELLVAPCGFIKSSTSNTTRSIHWTNQQQISIVIPWNYLSLSIIIYHHDSSIFIISIFFRLYAVWILSTMSSPHPHHLNHLNRLVTSSPHPICPHLWSWSVSGVTLTNYL